MISYRDATPADLPAVDALFRRSFAATFGDLYAPDDLAAFFAGFTPEAWAAELAQPDLAIRLAEGERALLGFAKVSDVTLPIPDSGRALELRQLYLDEATKGTGVADTLMAWVIDMARGRDATSIVLSVFSDNQRARRFYARYGFEYVQLYRFMVGGHADEDHILRLAL